MQGCKAFVLLCKGLWLAAALLYCHWHHLWTLITLINIYVPQVKLDPTAVHSGRFIIKLKREDGQWQQKDTRADIQTDIVQQNCTTEWYTNSKGIYCFAFSLWQMIKVLAKHRVNGSCIIFYSVISKLLGLLLQNFTLIKKKGRNHFSHLHFMQ